MNILITGATGFIGSHLLSALIKDENFNPAIIIRKTSDLKAISDIKDGFAQFTLEDDCSNINTIIKEAQPQCVVHLASLFLSAHSSDQIDNLINSNLLFPTKLLEAMVENNVKHFINTGTSWENINGSKEYDPVNLYAASKKAFEDVMVYYMNARQLNAITLKLYDTYGPKDYRGKLFSLLKKVSDSGETIDFSPGEQTLDLLYVDDVIEAYKKALLYIVDRKKSEHETFFIGCGVELTLKNIVKTFEEVRGKELHVNWGGRDYREREVMKAKADIGYAKKKLGWSPRVSLKEGIAKMLNGGSSSD